jgi:hypothetical protein
MLFGHLKRDPRSPQSIVGPAYCVERCDRRHSLLQWIDQFTPQDLNVRWSRDPNLDAMAMDLDDLHRHIQFRERNTIPFVTR